MARSITFPKEDNRVEIPFGYNIDDPRFWDKSVVWKKGLEYLDITHLKQQVTWHRGMVIV